MSWADKRPAVGKSLYGFRVGALGPSVLRVGVRFGFLHRGG